MARRLVALGTVSAAILILVASLAAPRIRDHFGSAKVAIEASVFPAAVRWGQPVLPLPGLRQGSDSDWGGTTDQNAD
jgi:hypothetical protein